MCLNLVSTYAVCILIFQLCNLSPVSLTHFLFILTARILDNFEAILIAKQRRPPQPLSIMRHVPGPASPLRQHYAPRAVTGRDGMGYPDLTR